MPGDLLAGLAVAVNLAGVGSASDANPSGGDRSCGDSRESARKAFMDAVQENSKCRRDSECEVVSILVCPLGCYVAVTKKDAQKVRDLAKEMSGRCECKYKCPPLPERASCKKGHCTIAN